jgi:hypothetical protein
MMDIYYFYRDPVQVAVKDTAAFFEALRKSGLKFSVVEDLLRVEDPRGCLNDALFPRSMVRQVDARSNAISTRFDVIVNMLKGGG